MSVIIDMAADPAVHSVTAVVGHILVADTVATPPT